MTFDAVRKIGLSMDNAEDGTSYGTPALKVGGTLFARLREDGDSLVLRTTFEERDELLAADPDTYYITDHYLSGPWILVRLSRVHPDAMRDLLAMSRRYALAAKGSASGRRAGTTRPRRVPQRKR